MSDRGGQGPGQGPRNGASTPDPVAAIGHPVNGNGGPVEPAAPGLPVPEAGPVPPGAEVRHTRTGGLWVGLTASALVLLFLLIFIVQNQDSAEIHFLGASGSLPVGVALLLAAVCGVLLVAIPGYARIMQLRRAARRAGRR